MSNQKAVADIEELTKQLEPVISHYESLTEQEPSPDHFYSILDHRIARGRSRELFYQNTLNYFLDPNQPHGFGSSILEAFFQMLDEKFSSTLFKKTSEELESVRIATEVHLKRGDEDSRPIDMLINGKSTASEPVPNWALFIELKVEAQEGEEQTPYYHGAEKMRPPWKDEFIDKNRISNQEYLYVHKSDKKDPKGNFCPITWKEIATHLPEHLPDHFFDLPNRSVVQFTDFIRSLKETAKMEDKDKNLLDRADLYMKHHELLESAEEARANLSEDLENWINSELQVKWADDLRDHYQISGSDWYTETGNKWGWISPEAWREDTEQNELKVGFLHKPTKEHIVNKRLSFRFRLPPQRAATKYKGKANKSFKDIFREQLRGNNDLRKALQHVNKVKILESDTELLRKDYPLELNNNRGNLYTKYIDRLCDACEEFCENEDLIEELNEAYEKAHDAVYGPTSDGFPAEPLK